MASIRQRAGTWQARIRRKGFPYEVKSFPTKTEAQAWVRSVESAMDKGVHDTIRSARDILLSDLLQRYRDEVSPTKLSMEREYYTIHFLLRHKIAPYSMDKITPSVVASFRDERLRSVSAGTIIRDLSILSSIISHARREWGLPTPNPCALVRKPTTPRGCSGLLTSEEEAALLHELKPIRRRSP